MTDKTKQHRAFDVIQRVNGKRRITDTVFYSTGVHVDADEVRRALIDHDSYPSDIEVYERD